MSQPNVLVDGHAVPLLRERLTFGKDPTNDIVIADPTVSRTHAVIELIGESYAIVDLGSRNGTSVNGERIFGHRMLHPGDEIRLGRARMIYDIDGRGGTETLPVEPAPVITHREKDVLIELCRPLLAGTVFTEPTSSTDIARALFISEAAIRMHLSRLYRRFGIDDSTPGRRARLATAALDRGAVSTADLRR